MNGPSADESSHERSYEILAAVFIKMRAQMMVSSLRIVATSFFFSNQSTEQSELNIFSLLSSAEPTEEDGQSHR